MKPIMTLSLNVWQLTPKQLRKTIEHAIQCCLDTHQHALSHPPQWNAFYEHLHGLDLLERWWNYLQILQHVTPTKERAHFLHQYHTSVQRLFSAVQEDLEWHNYVQQVAHLDTLTSFQQETIADYLNDIAFDHRLSARDKKRLHTLRDKKNNVLQRFYEQLDEAQSQRIIWPSTHEQHFLDEATDTFHEADGIHIPHQQETLIDLLQYATDGPIRSELFNVYNKIGQQQRTPHYAKKWLHLCHQEAKLLGFNSPCHQFLHDNVFHHPEALITFLRQERTRHYQLARQEQQPLLAFMKDYGIDNKPENMWFAMNQYIAYYYHQTEDDVVPYFRFNTTLVAVHQWIEQTFGVTIREHPHRTLWDPAVQCYQMFQQDTLMGEWIVDPYQREHKYTDCSTSPIASYEQEGPFQSIPSCLMSFNFEPESEAFFWHQVQTVWHEYGHLLHHILTKHPHPVMNGLRCPFDYIELPSMAMEKIPEQYPIFATLARQANGLPITAEHHAQWQQSHHDFEHHEQFHTLSLALYDVLIYTYDTDPQQLWQQIWTELPPLYGVGIPYNYVIGQDTHIISDNYAGGTYSYYWGDYLIDQLNKRYGEPTLWFPTLLQHTLAKGSQNAQTYLAPFIEDIKVLLPSNHTAPTPEASFVHVGQGPHPIFP